MEKKVKTSQDESGQEIQVQLCTFKIGEENYVLDIMRIREIIRPLPLTPLHSETSVFDGVIDLRGEVIPVIDLRRVFNAERNDSLRSVKQVIANVGDMAVALVVDAVGRVIIASMDDIRTLPAMDNISSEVVPGFIRYQGRLYLMLNLKALMEKGELGEEFFRTPDIQETD